MSKNTRHSNKLELLRKQINAAMKDPMFIKNLYKSTNNITRIIEAICTTQGEGWAEHVVDEDGNPSLTPKEQQQFTEAFRPHILFILQYFNLKKQRGGANAVIPNVKPAVNIKPAESNTNSKEVTTEKKKDVLETVEPAETAETAAAEQAAAEPVEPAEPAPTSHIGIDDMYTKAVDMVGQINSTAHSFASNYGILHYQREFEKDGDIPLIPEILANLIAGLTGPSAPATKQFLSSIKVPIRTIVFIIHLALDAARISMSVVGGDSERKILSVVVALVELLKGDWKQAIMSLIGYYGTTPMLIGQYIKIFLYLFQSLAPHLQEDIVFGVLSVTKSLLIGILLTIFKVTAPYDVRKIATDVFDKIREKNNAINNILTDENLEPRSDYFSPSMDDFNNLQSLISGDKDYICSCEYNDIIAPLDDPKSSSIIRIILQILGIPISKEFRERECGKPIKCLPYVSSLVKSSLPKDAVVRGEPSEPVEPKTDEPVEPKTDEPKTDEPVEPKTDELKTDEPAEPKTDEFKTDEPAEPKTDEPKTDEPKTDEPKTDEPKPDEPAEPKTDEPKTDEPKPDEPVKPTKPEPEPAKPEPAKPEPAKPEPAKPEPAKPAKPEPPLPPVIGQRGGRRLRYSMKSIF